MNDSTWTGGFGFSEAQEMYRRAVREFAEKEIASEAKARNKTELASAEDIKSLLRKLYDSGLFGMEELAKHGWQPGDWTTTAIAVEELTKVDFFTGFMSLVLKRRAYNYDRSA